MRVCLAAVYVLVLNAVMAFLAWPVVFRVSGTKLFLELKVVPIVLHGSKRTSFHISILKPVNVWGPSPGDIYSITVWALNGKQLDNINIKLIYSIVFVRSNFLLIIHTHTLGYNLPSFHTTHSFMLSHHL